MRRAEKGMTRATGRKVILRPREDLFSETDRDVGLQMVCLANSITAVPDNMACCEIISVGELVQNVAEGDLAFIDFYEVSQGYILANDELYIAECEVFKALYRPEDQTILPLNNYVVTRRCQDRMAVALTGTDRVVVPPRVLTAGIAGGKTAGGGIATHVTYEEVVAVGKLTSTGLPGLMTPAERELIEYAISGKLYFISDLEKRIEAVVKERSFGRPSDINPGDLVVFCEEIGQKIRVRGEFQHIVPYTSILATIDDSKILEAAIKRDEAGKLVRM